MEARDPYDVPRGPRAERDSDGDGDAIDHLWNAAHEMLLAMRTLVDAADEFVESQRGGRPSARAPHEARAGRVHHIDIDGRPEPRAAIDIDVDAS
jgi:hypothetical protein